VSHLVTGVAAAVAAVAAMALASPVAAPEMDYEPSVSLTTLTVDGTDYPVCAYEDCSDQPNQVGLWLDTDTGDWWLSLGEKSYLVVDDTVTP